MSSIRVFFALPGLHRVHRGAEVAFEAIAEGLARQDDFDVTVAGSGPEIPGRAYRYVNAGLIPRERFEHWPKVPLVRSGVRYEELTWMWGLRKIYEPSNYDFTCTCSFPFTNWLLRSGRTNGRPKHVFITENSDYPAVARNSEYRWFSCDTLVCTNPEYEERNRARWSCALIPNGIDVDRFSPLDGAGNRASFDLPESVPLVLMVSALVPIKHVLEGIQSVAQLPDVHLAIAGDGELRDACRESAERLMPGRYHNLSVTPDRMPELYRCADVFLHMSREEAFGNVYIEALSTGLTVVGHDYPTARWILGEQGILVDTTETNRVTEALRSALANPPDDGKRMERHSAVGARFDWPVVIDQYAGLFRKIISNA